MATTASVTAPHGLARVFSWRRLQFTLGVALIFSLFFSARGGVSVLTWIERTVTVSLVVLFVFGVFERRPKRLPKWLARSALQIVALAVVIPPTAGFAFSVTTDRHAADYDREKSMMSYGVFTFTCILFAPWIAVGAMFKQRDAYVREQALAFDLEKSELEREALNARLRLLQAQVEPHFIFNTLANVQALVESGSPQASNVLASLISYLKAAVPRMHDSMSTLDQELQLVRAYLEVMQMRMPDRLQFSLRVDPSANTMQCPPTTLLTLVENAVRHGIDPGEEGGRIDIDVALRQGRCYLRVADTGVGLHAANRGQAGLGTGLATLRERLQLSFGGDAQLQLMAVQPHGVCVEVDFPARKESA
jgi:two-component sensor histidine kinase